MCVVNKMLKLVSQCIDFIIGCQQNLVIDPKAFRLITYKLYIDKWLFFHHFLSTFFILHILHKQMVK